MGSKRKVADPSAGAPARKKRVTRSSSTLALAPQEQEQEPTPGKSEITPAARRRPKAIRTKKDVQASTKPDGQSFTVSTSGVQISITKLNITHPSIKTPISCNQYHASTAAKTPGSTATPCIFTHGAGGTMSTPAVRDFCVGYAAAQSAAIVVFQGPANLTARVKGFHACVSHFHDVADAPSKTSTSPTTRTCMREGRRRRVVLGGRSMGSRAAVVAASEILSSSSSSSLPASSEEAASVSVEVSLILVSYPLQGPKNEIRDQILFDLPPSVRVLFIIGDRDAMCPLDLLERTRKKMVAGSQLVVVQGADHGMHVRPKGKETECGEETGRLAVAWVAGQMGESVVYVAGDG